MGAREDYQRLMDIAREADAAGDAERAKLAVDKARNAKQVWLKGSQQPANENATGLIREGLQGMTFGWGDEIGAAAAAVPGYMNQTVTPPYKPQSYGEVYEDIRGTLASQRDEFRGRHPVAAPVTEMAGAMATGVPGVFRNTFPKAAAIGAAEGGIYGAGAAEPGSRGEGAAWGAGLSAPLATVGLGLQRMMAPRPEASRIAAIAEAQGVPLYRSDISPFARKMERTAEMMPVGRGQVIGARDSQLGAIDQRIASDLESIDRASGGYIGPEGVDRSLRERMGERRRQAGTLYDEVAARSDEMGPIDAPMSREALAEGWLEETAKAPQRRNQGVVDMLEGFDEDLYKTDLDFNTLRDMRSDANAAIADARKGGSQITTKGTQHLGRLAGALESDLENVGTARAQGAWRDADNFYRENVAGMYKNTALSRMLDKETPEQAITYALQPGVASNAELSSKLHSSLTPQGTSAMRGEAMRAALDKATDETGKFSPAKFATYVSKRQALFDKFFDEGQVRDVAHLMRVIQDAPNVGAMPRTGFTGAAVTQSILPIVGAVAGGAGGADPMGALGYAGGAYATQALVGMVAAAIANKRITPRQVQNAIIRSMQANTGLARALESLGVQNSPAGAVEE